MKIRNPISEPLDIIILAGQSNMEGNGLGDTSEPWIPDSDILMMYEDIVMFPKKNSEGREFISITRGEDYFIATADERLSSDKNKRCAVLALPFAKLYKKERLEKGRRLLLVQTAIGGSGFVGAHWGIGEEFSERLFDMVDLALGMNQENRVIALLWHQGEHDAYENAGKDPQVIKDYYKEKLSAFILSVRERYGATLPFVAAGYTNRWLCDYPKEATAVTEASVELCLADKNASFVEKTGDLPSNDDLISNGDSVHFSRPALYELGRRYYAAFSELSV